MPVSISEKAASLHCLSYGGTRYVEDARELKASNQFHICQLFQPVSHAISIGLYSADDLAFRLVAFQ